MVPYYPRFSYTDDLGFRKLLFPGSEMGGVGAGMSITLFDSPGDTIFEQTLLGFRGGGTRLVWMKGFEGAAEKQEGVSRKDGIRLPRTLGPAT